MQITRKYDYKYGLKYPKFFGISIAKIVVWIFVTPPLHEVSCTSHLLQIHHLPEFQIHVWTLPAACGAAELHFLQLAGESSSKSFIGKEEDLEIGSLPPS